VSGSDAFDTTMVSPWNSKRTALKAFMDLCERLPVKYLLISYNDESLVPHDDLVKALKDKYGAVHITRVPYQRNIMAQIGNAEHSDLPVKTKNMELLLWVRKN
jgi:adenine-specific DNA methylase